VQLLALDGDLALQLAHLLGFSAPGCLSLPPSLETLDLRILPQGIAGLPVGRKAAKNIAVLLLLVKHSRRPLRHAR
jgi:hypothetical protein